MNEHRDMISFFCVPMSSTQNVTNPNDLPVTSESSMRTPQAVFGFLQDALKRDIYLLIQVGDIETVKQLLPQMNINQKDSAGNTPLHHAVYHGQLEIVHLLLDNGADATAQNSADGHTPLHWACLHDKPAIAHTLITKAKSNMLFCDSRGYNAFHTAAMHGHLNLLHFLTIHYVSTYGTSVQDVGEGWTGFSTGATSPLPPCVTGLVDIRDSKGHTSLHWAAYKGHLNVVMYLIRLGADVNAKDSLGNTPLHWAAQQKQDAVISLLVRHGGDPKQVDSKNQTPALHAIKKSHLSTAHNITIATYTPWTIVQTSSSFVMRLGWLLPALFISCSMLFAYFLPFWIWMLLFALQMLAYLIYYTPFVRKSSRNPVFQSLLVFGTIINSGYWFFYVITTGDEYLWQPLNIAIPFFGIMSIVYGIYTASRADPGTIRTSFTVENSRFATDLLSGANPKLCPTCLSRRTIRSKHCAHCNSCIAGFDHHCVWINNCVGYKNYGPFLIFLVGIVVTELMGIILWLNYLSILIAPLSKERWMTKLGYCWKVAPDLIFLLIILVPTWIIQFLAFITQVQNIVKGSDMFERMAPDRFEYISKVDGTLINPFNQGILNNLAEKFNPKIDYLSLHTTQDVLNAMSDRTMYTISQQQDGGMV